MQHWLMIPGFGGFFSCIVLFGLTRDGFDSLGRICLLSDLFQWLHWYPLCRDSCWIRFPVALKQVLNCFSFTLSQNFPKQFHLEHFPPLPAGEVICIKSGCDVTDKRPGTSDPTEVGRRKNNRTPKMAWNRAFFIFLDGLSNRIQSGSPQVKTLIVSVFGRDSFFISKEL